MEEPLYYNFPPKISQQEALIVDDQKQKQDDDEEQASKTKVGNNNNNKLALLPLMFLIYFHVSGGPYGQEPAVGAAGPFFAILGFVAFPILWGVPEALVTAELSAAFPSNGGFVLWAHAAFGPFWAYLMGWWRFLSGVINLASFPALCIGYVEAVGPTSSLATSSLGRFSVVVLSTTILSAVNYTGLHIAAYAAIPLAVLSLVPFLVMSVVAIPKIDPSRWVFAGGNNNVGRNKEWKRFFNSLFWNLNSWDSVSTLVGEVKAPLHQTLPKALASTLGFTSLAYLVPLLASIGAVKLDLDDWVDGYYLDVAEKIAGSWLKHWLRLGSVLSASGLYQAQLGSCSYQLQGMADLGVLPRFFGCRCKWFDTPWVGILVSTLVGLVVSALRLENLRIAVNFLYSMGMVVELGSFVWLRVKQPETERPFRVPIEGVRKLIAMCSVPGVFMLYVMCVAGGGVYLITVSLTFIAVACYFIMKVLRTNNWLQFNNVHQEPSYYKQIVK